MYTSSFLPQSILFATAWHFASSRVSADSQRRRGVREQAAAVRVLKPKKEQDEHEEHEWREGAGKS